MTDEFVNFILSIKKENISSSQWSQVRRTFLDYLSVVIAGSKCIREKEVEYIESFRESGDCSVFGYKGKVPMQVAALMNGMSAHVVELDDGHRKGAIHVGATIYSALLAVAEHEKISSEDFLFGAILGYEATVRLACAVQPGNKLRGYHATGTCGTVGATVAIAVALGFNFSQIKSAISAAVTSAAGVLEMQEDNADYKPLNVGRAAMDAVASAYLGKAGFVPPFDAIGGKRGFLKVMTDDPHPELLTKSDKDEPLAITQIYMKTYAACRHTHPAIEAALFLREKYAECMNISDIQKIEVQAYKLAVLGHDHTDILGVSSANMSMPFSVALALSRGSAGMEDYFSQNNQNREFLLWTQKVSVVENPELTALVPQKRASILNVILKNGKVLSKIIDYPKGEPENPLTDSEIEHKFCSLAMSCGMSSSKCKKIIAEISMGMFDVRELLNMCEF